MMPGTREQLDIGHPASSSAPDPASEPIEAALYHLTDASIALRCIVGPLEAIAQATARDIDRYAVAIEAIAR
jgi:hypothetical protein